MPEISFKIDDTLEHTQHIYELLNKLERPKEEPEDGEDNKGDTAA
jgi:hypothetical protein